MRIFTICRKGTLCFLSSKEERAQWAVYPGASYAALIIRVADSSACARRRDAIGMLALHVERSGCVFNLFVELLVFDGFVGGMFDGRIGIALAMLLGDADLVLYYL